MAGAAGAGMVRGGAEGERRPAEERSSTLPHQLRRALPRPAAPNPPHTPAPPHLLEGQLHGLGQGHGDGVALADAIVLLQGPAAGRLRGMLWGSGRTQHTLRAAFARVWQGTCAPPSACHAIVREPMPACFARRVGAALTLIVQPMGFSLGAMYGLSCAAAAQRAARRCRATNRATGTPAAPRAPWACARKEDLIVSS